MAAKTDAPEGLDAEIDRGWFSPDLAGPAIDEAGATPSPLAVTPGMSEVEWQRVVESLQVLERELTCEVDPRRRAQLCWEVGRTYETRLGDDRRAVTAYQRAHRADPHHLPSLRSGRRIFERAARWPMVLRLLDAELRAVPSASARAALLVEKGEIYLKCAEPDHAATCFRAALELEPECRSAAAALVRWASGTGEGAALSHALETAAGLCATPSMRARVLLEAACVLQSSDPLDPSATALLEQAHAADPHDEEVADRLARTLQRGAHWERLIALYSSFPERLDASADRAARLTESARLLADRVGDSNRAEVFLEQALKTDPFFAPALELSAVLAERTGRFPALVAALQRLSEVTTEPAVRVRILMRMAAAQASNLGDEEGAIGSLERVLAVAPQWWPAREMLGRAFARRGDWERLVQLYEEEVELTTGEDRARSDRLYRLGELLESRLRQDVRAEVYYRWAVEGAPEVPHFVEAWLRVLRRIGDAERLVRALTLAVQRTDSTEERVALLEELAELRETRLRDPAGAKEAWSEVARLRPEHREARRRLQRLSMDLGAYEDALHWMEIEIAQGPEPRRLVSLLVACADLCEQHLSDRNAARRHLERALELDPRYVPALRASGRLYQATGALAQLVDMTRREAELASSPADAAAIWMRVGTLCREELADFDAAARAWERTIELAPDPLPAIRALQTLYGDVGEVEREAEMLGAEAERLVDPGERIALWCRLGSIWLYRAGRPELAIEAWQQALAVDPCTEHALQPLLSLLEERGLVHEIAATWRRCAEAAPTPAMAARAWVELARVCADRLGLEVEAIDACERALAVTQGAAQTAPLVLLQRLYRAATAPRALASVHRRLAVLTLEREGRLAHLETAAHLLDVEVDDADAAIDAWRAVLAVDPTHGGALDRLEERLPAGEARIEVHTRRITGRTEVREVVGALVARAEALRALDRLPEAIADLEHAVELDPNALLATRALREVLTAAGRGDDALRATEREARVTRDAAASAELFLVVARVREQRLSDPAGAFEAARAALERAPSEDEAARTVQRIGERLGRFAEVAHALEHRAQASPERAVESLLEVSRIYAQRLGAPELAVRALNQALMSTTGDRPTILQRLADLYVEAEDWNEAIVVYQRLREAAPDPELRRAVAFRIASIFEDKLSDLSRARDALQSLLGERPGDPDVQLRLARLAEGAGDLEAAIELTRGAVGVVKDPELAVELEVRVARLLEQRGRLDEAIEVYRSVLRTAPERADVALRAAELLGRRGDLSAVMETLGTTLDKVRAKSTPDTARLRRRAAELFVSHDPVRAVRELEALVADDPDDTDARQALVGTLVARESWEAALPHLTWLVARDPFALERVSTLRRALSRTGAHVHAAWLSTWLELLECASDEDRQASARLPDFPRYPALVRPVSARAEGSPTDTFESLVVTWVKALPRVFATPPTLPSRDPGLPALEALARRCGAAVGLDEVRVLVDRTLGDGVRYTDGTPPLLVFGATAVAELSPAEQAFHIVRGLELGRRHLAVLTSWPASTLETLLRTAALLPRASGERSHTVDESQRAHVAQLESLLDRRGRDAVAGTFDALDRHLASTDVAATIDGWWVSANVAAMRIAGPRAAWSVLARTAPSQVRALPVLDRWRATPCTRAMARAVIEGEVTDLPGVGAPGTP